MIELASDPNASRMDWRPGVPGQAPRPVADERREGRSGHAWPFISRYAQRPAAKEAPQPQASGSNSGS